MLTEMTTAELTEFCATAREQIATARTLGAREVVKSARRDLLAAEAELLSRATTKTIRILDRDEVREGDLVTAGGLGYRATGTALLGSTLNATAGQDLYEADDLLVGAMGLSWYSNFLWAEREVTA